MPRPTDLGQQLRRALTDPDPVQRLTAIAQLRRDLDALETETAADALRAGLSWRQIGEGLGISKQAAHRRHSKQISELDRAAETQDSGNVAIVAPDARRAVQIARREAAMTGQRSLGTEHLLLGLLQCGDSQTAALLSRFGMSAARVRTAMESTVELPLETARQAIAARDGIQPMAEEPALSPLTHSVVSRALKDTVRRGSRSLTALDLLDALLLHDHGGAAQTLIGLGVSPAEARSEIARLQQLSRREPSEPHDPARTDAAEVSPSAAS